MTPDLNALIERLEAPAYWMSGSQDGHEGENDAPRLAAQALRALQAQPAPDDVGRLITRLSADLAAAEKRGADREREECAKVAEVFASSAGNTLRPDINNLVRSAVQGNIAASLHIAATIRSRGE